VPSGKRNLTVSCDGYGFHRETFDLVAGENRITLRMSRLASVRLELRAAGEIIPWPESAYAVAEDEHGVLVKSVIRRSDIFELGFYEPGIHRIVVSAIDGYWPVPPFTVDVHRGESILHTIALERR
jgi:hypothetical protein